MATFYNHCYHVYITTNPGRTVLYTGVTNNLGVRLQEHWQNRGKPKTFAGKFYCYNLLHFEEFKYIREAIAREKELKGWSRQKKMDLIKIKNPKLLFLNSNFCFVWPPKKVPKRF